MGCTREFSLFPRLPAAVRIRVWSLVQTPYQSCHVHAIRGFSKDSLKGYPIEGLAFKLPGGLSWANGYIWALKGGYFVSTSAPPPHPLLYVCKESRNYVITRHDLVYAFGAYINPYQDIIFLDYSPGLGKWLSTSTTCGGVESFGALLDQPELVLKLQNLAILDESEEKEEDERLEHSIIPQKPRRDNIWVKRISELCKVRLRSVKKVYFVHYGNDVCEDPRRLKPSGRRLFLDDITNAEVEPEKYKSLEERWGVDEDGNAPEFRHALLSFPPDGVDYQGVMMNDDGDEILESGDEMDVDLPEASSESTMMNPTFERSQQDQAYGWRSFDEPHHETQPPDKNTYSDAPSTREHSNIVVMKTYSNMLYQNSLQIPKGSTSENRSVDGTTSRPQSSKKALCDSGGKRKYPNSPVGTNQKPIIGNPSHRHLGRRNTNRHPKGKSLHQLSKQQNAQTPSESENPVWIHLTDSKKVRRGLGSVSGTQDRRTIMNHKSSLPSPSNVVEEKEEEEIYLIDYRKFPSKTMLLPPASRVMQMSARILEDVHKKPSEAIVIDDDPPEVIVIDDSD